MESVTIDLNESLLSEEGGDEEKQFILDLYDEAKKRSKRENSDFIYISDLLYDAIPRVTSDQVLVWWIADDHPLVIMLKHNHNEREMYSPVGNVNSPLGKISIYTDAVMQEAVETVLNLCLKMQLKVFK
jgi:hypothetical protein